jgi:hypothetical protein
VSPWRCTGNVLCVAYLVVPPPLVHGLLLPARMANKRSAVGTVRGRDHVRGRQLQQEVRSIVRGHLEDACVRSWTEISQRFGGRPLFANSDPSAVIAHSATRALVTLVVNGLSRLAVAALLLPSIETRPARRRSTTPPRLMAIPGGLRNGGDA